MLLLRFVLREQTNVTRVQGLRGLQRPRRKKRRRLRVLAAWFDYIMFETIFDVLFKMLNTLLIRWLHTPYIVWNVDVLIRSSLFFWLVIH